MSIKNERRGVGRHFDGDLRRVLLDAALAEHADVGLEQMSLRGVARRAGVSHAAPAHHFGDKAGLLTAIATEGFELLLDGLTAANAASAGDAVNYLKNLGLAYAEFAAAHPSHFDVMFRSSALHNDAPELVHASAAAYDALRDHVSHMQSTGWHRNHDLTELTTSTWALIHGLSTLRATGALDSLDHDTSPSGVVSIAAAILDPPRETFVADR